MEGQLVDVRSEEGVEVKVRETEVARTKVATIVVVTVVVMVVMSSMIPMFGGY